MIQACRAGGILRIDPEADGLHAGLVEFTERSKQQRFPEPGYVSETLSALLTYVTVNANGQVYRGPGIKR